MISLIELREILASEYGHLHNERVAKRLLAAIVAKDTIEKAAASAPKIEVVKAPKGGRA